MTDRDDSFGFVTIKREGTKVAYDKDAGPASPEAYARTWFEVPIPVELLAEFEKFYEERMARFHAERKK